MKDYSEFVWTDANAKEAERIIARYPKGREASAIMPLLWLAQYQ
ncbi:MAG: NAD(P)H-dependent oxidoreductase subunit E, partial [Sphingomonadaceae bacterium]